MQFLPSATVTVAALALTAGVPVLAPDTPNTPEVISHIAMLQPDLLLSFYYRRLLCPALLALPRLGAINLHGSLLPKYRGRAPVNWVLVNGETHTGATLHHMIAQADAGDIITQRVVSIAFEDTALTLFEKVAQAAVEPNIRPHGDQRRPRSGFRHCLSSIARRVRDDA